MGRALLAVPALAIRLLPMVEVTSRAAVAVSPYLNDLPPFSLFSFKALTYYHIPIPDSTAGKLMEKVGGMFGNDKMQEKGFEKREQAGYGQDSSEGGYGGGRKDNDY